MTMSIIVDDSDPLIQYSIPNGLQTDISSSIVTNNTLLDKAIGNTLHNLSIARNSNFAFNFMGTEIGVYALLSPGPPISSPPWSCNLDGDLTTPPIIQGRTTPTIIEVCSEVGLSSGLHNLFFNFESVPSDHIDFFLDYIEYIPVPSANLGMNSYIGISADDPSIHYSTDPDVWRADDGTVGLIPDGENENITFTFNGSALTMIGVIPTGISPTGIYSIDSEPYSIFNISPSPLNVNNSDPALQPGNIMFQATSLDPATHTITIAAPNFEWAVQSIVVANGIFIANSSTTPIASVASNSTSSISLPSSTTTSLPTGLPTPRANGKSTTHTTVTLASVLVVVTMFAAIAATWRWYSIRSRHKSADHNLPLVHPFQYTPVTFLQAMLTGQMGVEIKARRQIDRREDGTRIFIPPSKLRSVRNNTTVGAEPSNIQEGPRGVEDIDVAQDNEHADISDARSDIIRVQAEDSGMRGIEERGRDDRRVIVVPPAYTPA